VKAITNEAHGTVQLLKVMLSVVFSAILSDAFQWYTYYTLGTISKSLAYDMKTRKIHWKKFCQLLKRINVIEVISNRFAAT